jgi:hypothetical protein
MGIACKLMGHEVDSSAIVWNDRMSHSRCSRCGAHLIRRGRRWRDVPRGYRVVWRSPVAGDTVWFNSPRGWNRLRYAPANAEIAGPLELPAPPEAIGNDDID